MKHSFIAILAGFALGCASAQVRPYVGSQQAWPTSGGSIVNVHYGLPIFTSLPPSPYEVLAQLRLESPFYAQPEEGHMPVLVKQAIKLGADAIVFVDGSFFSNNYGPATASPTGRQSSVASYTQINRFMPDSFKPDVQIIAVRWIGDAPRGLPKYQFRTGTMATPPAQPAAEPIPAPVTVPEAPKPQPAPSVTPVTPKPAPTHPAPAPPVVEPPSVPAEAVPAPAPSAPTPAP
jgi:hypothetical protein